MKVQIEEKDGMHLTLLFPSSLIGFIIGSRFARKMVLKALQITSSSTARDTFPEQASSDQTSPEMTIPDQILIDRGSPGETLPALSEILTDEMLKRLQKELKKALKKHRHLTLVDVTSASGDHVKVTL